MILTTRKFLLEGKHIALALKSRINDVKSYMEISQCCTLTAVDMKVPYKSQFVSFP